MDKILWFAWNCRIILVFWETAHLLLPWLNVNICVSLGTNWSNLSTRASPQFYIFAHRSGMRERSIGLMKWVIRLLSISSTCLWPVLIFNLHQKGHAQLTFTACNFPITSTSGTSWYHGDKLRATYTAKLAGSKTRRVGPMFSPSVMTALKRP